MKYRIVKRINPLNKTEEKYYAAPQYMEELTVLDLAKDISDACTLNVTDVEAVLQLGNFGRVKLSFSSKGYESPENVDASSITSKRILFTPSSELKNEIEKASFSKV